MSVEILYFAGLRAALGCPGESLELPAGVTTVAALRDWLVAAGRHKLAETRNLRCAVNQDMASPDTPIRDGDEVAFFPPVTGG